MVKTEKYTLSVLKILMKQTRKSEESTTNCPQDTLLKSSGAEI
jgi:hypothetical protein